MTVRELIRESEAMIDEQNRDCNVPKVLFYHLANKEPHELYLMMDEEVDKEVDSLLDDVQYNIMKIAIKKEIGD